MKDKIDNLIFLTVILLIVSVIIFIVCFLVKQFNDLKKESYTVEYNASYKDTNRTIEVYETRLTSFYTGDECNTGSITASGLSTENFETNDKGWYTYQDKLVVATANKRLGTTNMKTYNLYDELILVINGEQYKAIVLDVCGACMRYNRIDLFVSGKHSVIDTKINFI